MKKPRMSVDSKRRPRAFAFKLLLVVMAAVGVGIGLACGLEDTGAGRRMVVAETPTLGNLTAPFEDQETDVANPFDVVSATIRQVTGHAGEGEDAQPAHGAAAGAGTQGAVQTSEKTAPTTTPEKEEEAKAAAKKAQIEAAREHAAETSGADTPRDTTGSESPVSGDSPAPAPAGEPESVEGGQGAEASEPEPEVAPEPEAKPTYLSTTLEQSIKATDGSTYIVRVSFNEDARLPEDTELHVEGTSGDYVPSLRSALGFAGEDWLRRAVAFDVSLVSDGNEVELAAPAVVEVETAVPAPESDGLEIALLSGASAGKVSVTNVTSRNDHSSRVRFESVDLGTIGVAEVAAKKLSWTIRDQEVTVWGPEV